MADDNGFVDLNKTATKAEKEGKGSTKGLLVGLIIAFTFLILLLIIGFITAVRYGLISLPDGIKDPAGKKGSEAGITGVAEHPGDNGENISPTDSAAPTAKATPTVTHAPVAAKHCADLNAAITESGINRRNNINAAVETIDGREYLVIRTDRYAISVMNDYTLYGSDPYYNIRITDGRIAREFAWPYAINGGSITGFLPEFADFVGNGREQAAFILSTDEENTRNDLHVIATKDMLEYYTVNPGRTFADTITVADLYDVGSARIAKLVANDRSYYVTLPYMALEEAQQKYTIETDIETKYLIRKNAIEVRSLVMLDNGGYIGEMRSPVTFTSRDMFEASSCTFYLYSDDDFSDKDHVGIVSPISYDLTHADRVTTTGANGERLLVKLRDNVPRTTLDPDKYAYDPVTGLKGYYEDGKNIAMFGVDVSRWNENIDWTRAAAAGVEFAIIRAAYRGTAAEGNINTDPYFEQNIKNAYNAGVKVGAYFFSQATTVEEAVEEANYIIEVLRPYKDMVTFPVAFDTEKADNARANDLSADERTEIAKVFCETVKNAGYKPMIYFSTVWSLMYLNLEELTDYDIWYAYYSDDIYYPYDYKIWQYQSDGSVPGIPGHADMNVCFKDYSKE